LLLQLNGQGQAVYRAVVKAHHPDHGGDSQTMVRVNLAMETIRDHQQREDTPA
jgi:curved DNA-binding protein CbpA